MQRADAGAGAGEAGQRLIAVDRAGDVDDRLDTIVMPSPLISRASAWRSSSLDVDGGRRRLRSAGGLRPRAAPPAAGPLLASATRAAMSPANSSVSAFSA